MKYSFLLFIFIVGLSSCASLDVPELRGSEGFSQPVFDGNKISFKADVKVFNPNWFAIKVKPSILDVYIEDQYMGKIHLEKKVKMKAKRESTLEFPLMIELEDGAMITAMKYAGKETIELQFKGKVKGGVWFFSKKIEIDETKTISGKDLRLGGFNGLGL